MANPNNRFQLDLNNWGVYVNDPGGPKNGVYIGTDGNVTLEDVGWEAGLFSPTVAVESDLEKLISDLADEAGVTEIEFASFLFTVGIISLAGSAQTLFSSSPGWSISGELELDNAIMEVGDIVNLGDGNDVIRAGTGNDIVFGGDGNDQLRGEDGNDALFGGAGNDVLDGGADNDFLAGDSGKDVLRGGDGNDFLVGGSGDDVLKGGEGRDRMEGGDGADVLIAGDGGDDELLFLGTSPSSADPFFDRDNFEDVVRAAASFDKNGTDSIFLYSDGQGGAIPRDIIDLSDAFDFSADADTAVEREAELLDAFHVVAVSSTRADIRDLGGDGVIGGDDNIWFTVHEDANGTAFGAARPEVITVEVDGFTFEWDISVGATSWIEI